MTLFDHFSAAEKEALEVVRRALERTSTRTPVPSSESASTPTAPSPSLAATGLPLLSFLNASSRSAAAPQRASGDQATPTQATSTPPSHPAPLPSTPHAPFPSTYIAPPAREFTAEERKNKENEITRQTIANRFADHPLGAVVEYLECGQHSKEIIFHRFRVDPNASPFINPRDNVQYSLGGSTSNGGHPGRRCNWLTIDGKSAPYAERVPTNEYTFSCESTFARLYSIRPNIAVLGEGVKVCNFLGQQYHSEQHHYLSTQYPIRSRTSTSSSSPSAPRDVFEKTLGFFCALLRLGCSYPLRETSSGEQADSEDELASDDETNNGTERSGRAKQKCRGKIILEYSSVGVPSIR